MIVKSISFSSNKKLARCEQMFDYRYGQQLKPRVKKPGLFKGDWGHQILEAYYSHPIPTRGAQRVIRKGPPYDWHTKLEELIKTQWEPLFDEEKEMFGLDFPQQVEALVDHYVDYWYPQDSQWEVIHVEKAYELMTKIGKPIRWKSDLIVKDDGVLTLVETKFKKAIPDSSERLLQPQVHSYAFLLHKAGVPVEKIIWNYIRTEDVPRPQILKSGKLSERKINTDQRSYLTSLREANLYPTDEQSIMDLNEYLATLPETLSLERVTNSVNLKIGERHVRDWIERHRRALNIKRPLINWTRECTWDCDYYELCQADQRGDVDRRLIISRDFVKNNSEELK